MIMLIKNWKLIAAVALIGTMFATGWAVNGWRLNAKFAKTQMAVVAKHEELQQALNEEWRRKVKQDEAARFALSQNLAKVRIRTAELEAELNRVELTPKTPEIEVVQQETVECTDENVQIITKTVLANPFSSDFVKLWNSSAGSAGPD